MGRAFFDRHAIEPTAAVFAARHNSCESVSLLTPHALFVLLMTPYKMLTTRKRDNRARQALTAISNGLDVLDARLLYGVTEEELLACRARREPYGGVMFTAEQPASDQD